jgi:Arc/MetJ-type ribon-helix-helix transcriptional regulator
MVVKLPPDLAEFVSQQLASGRYATEDELLCDAVRTLRKHSVPRREDISPPETDYVLETREDLVRFLDEIDAEVDREHSLRK